MLKTLRCAFRSVAMPLLAACVLGLISTSAATAQAAVLGVASSEPRYAAIVVDASSGEVLYGQNADSPRYPASITKVMTLYLTFEALSEGRLKLTDRIVYSPHVRTVLRFAVTNLTNKVALYNFLSTFSGTHFVAPRAYQVSVGLVF